MVEVDNNLKPMSNQKELATINFKKAHSHVEKILKMLEENRYCIDVMQQNLAVIGLLKSAHQMLMENHLKSCFASAMQTTNKDKKNKMIEEILAVTKMFNK